MVSGSKGAGQLHATNMPDRVAHFILLESVRVAEGSEFRPSPANKDRHGGYRLSVERQKWLAQILEERARQPEICGFESFREAVVHEAERLASLIALPAFREQVGQCHRRPQLPGERRLRACDREPFGQAVHR